MAENYITRLKRESEEKDAKLAELEKQLAEAKTVAKPIVAPQEVPQEIIDDRDEIISVWIERVGSDAQGQAIFKEHKLPKREALEALVAHYITKKNKAVPSPSDYTDMNATVCYARLTKRDTSTGRKMTVIKDLPLWIAAERAIEGKVVELVSKQEYNQFYKERGSKEDDWKKQYYETKRRQALDMLSSME
jgi:hypothetical protein